jgi:hypothetical protein
VENEGTARREDGSSEERRTTERAATAPGPRESERGSGNGVGVEETLRGETEDGGREEEASGGRRRAAAAAATAAGADAG